MKIYSKIDYLKYLKDQPKDDYLGKILSKCFSNINENIIRVDIINDILNYKIQLTSLDKIGSEDYLSCSKFLESNWKNLSYKDIASMFGYDIIENPRTITERGTLSLFEKDISHGNLVNNSEYIDEYFSISYDLLRRPIVISSVLWDTSFSLEIKDAINCLVKKSNVFINYFNKEKVNFPEWMIYIRELKDINNFYVFSYSDYTYGDWKYNWNKATGKMWLDWDRDLELFHSRYEEAIEQYLDIHKNITMTMVRDELRYYSELSIIQGVSTIWKFINGDIPGDIKNNNLNKLVERLDLVGDSINADMTEFKEIANKLREHSTTYYDIDSILEILGYKCYI